MEDSTLAKKVKDENCEDSIKELINRHSKLCYAVYQRYFSAMRASGVTAEDAIDEKDLIIYKSAMSYNPTKKAKFSTWVGNQMRYACLNKMNKNKKYKPVLDDEIDLYIEKNFDQKDFSDIKEYAINILCQLKDSRIERVFNLRYFNGSPKCMTWSKIGKIMEVSSQTAINLHNRGKKILIRKLNKNYRSDFV